jgi:Sulfatase-modifying factor enzyme 1
MYFLILRSVLTFPLSNFPYFVFPFSHSFFRIPFFAFRFSHSFFRISFFEFTFRIYFFRNYFFRIYFFLPSFLNFCFSNFLFFRISFFRISFFFEFPFFAFPFFSLPNVFNYNSFYSFGNYLLDAIDFGWDNEFPKTTETVKEFEIGEYPITNKQFAEFVTSGNYNNPKYWNKKDWEWKQSIKLVRFYVSCVLTYSS